MCLLDLERVNKHAVHHVERVLYKNSQGFVGSVDVV